MRKYVAFSELPERQRAIGKRIRAMRKRIKLSQTKLAGAIGMTRDQLNNVELGRVALRFRPGWELCLALDVNPQWLASGGDDQYGCVGLSGMEEQPRDHDLFSEVLDDVVREDPHSHWPGYAKYRLLRLGSRKPNTPRLSLDDWLKQIRPELHADFLRFIDQAARRYINRSREVESTLTPAAVEDAKTRRSISLVEESQKNIDAESIKRYLMSPAMKQRSSWKSLRRRLRALTRSRGSQAELARRLGVTPQAVAEWLAGASAPTANTTLRILGWVENVEAQQKQSSRNQSARLIRSADQSRRKVRGAKSASA